MFNHNQGSGSNPMYNSGYPQQYQHMGRSFRGPAPMYNQFVPSTNKSFVRSLEEALSLPADFNSQNVYFDINQNVLYDVCTNGQGEKSWAVFDIAPRQNTIKTAATVDTAAPNTSYYERLSKLEKQLEELINGKRDVKQTDSTDAGSV